MPQLCIQAGGCRWFFRKSKPHKMSLKISHFFHRRPALSLLDALLQVAPREADKGLLAKAKLELEQETDR